MKINRMLSILLAVLMIVSTMPLAFANEYVGGIVGSTDGNVTIENAYNSGSVSNGITVPSYTYIDGKTFYQLATADDLYWFAEQVNVNKDYDINAVLTADIVINEDLWSKITVAEDGTATVNEGETVSSWTPIRYFINSDAVGYEGIFDGANHTISGLYINTGDAYMGLFALAKGATIKNLGITDSYFYGDYNVASVVSVARNTTISNCFSENCLIVNQDSSAGGIAAELINSNISGCYNTSDGSANRYGFSLTSVYATAPTAEYQRETAVVGHSTQSVAAQPATCTEIGWEAYEYCTVCDYTTYAEIAPIEHSFTNYIKSEDAECGVNAKETAACDNGCGATVTREIEGSALEHSFDRTSKSEDNLTRPTQNTDGTWNDGYYTYNCLNGCGATDTETVKRADYTAFDEAQVQFNAYLQDYNLTDEAVNAAMQRMMNFTIENGEVEEDLIETEQELINKAVVLCEEIFAEFEAGIADGTMIKADYTAIETYFYLLENGKWNEDVTAKLTAIEEELAMLKSDAETTQAEADVLCDELHELYDEIYLCLSGEHKWGEYKSNNNATCTVDGTKTATCIYCIKTDTVADTGTMKSHADANGDYKCDNGCGHEYEKPADPDTPTDDCDHICHSDFFLAEFIWKILNFFFKLFDVQQYCDCGITHY